jgi:hypothetical protein
VICNRRYRFEMVCPHCDGRAEMTWDKRHLPSVFCCLDCSNRRKELIPVQVLRVEVLDGCTAYDM